METSLARTPVDGGFVEVPTGRPPLSHRPPRPRPSPAPTPVPAEAPAGRSDAAGPAARAGVPGRATAAGWNFLDGPPGVAAPTTAGFVVEPAMDNAGFRVGGRPVRPADLATLIAAVCPLTATVLLVPAGAVTSAPAMTLLIGSLADALGRPVVVAAPGIRFTATGIALGEFRRFHPRAGRGVRRIEDLGPALPAPPGGLAPAAASVRPDPPVRPARQPAVPLSAPPGVPPDEPDPRPAEARVEATPPTPAPAVALHGPQAAAPPAIPVDAAVEPAVAPAPVDAALVALLAPRTFRAFATLAGPAPATAPGGGPLPVAAPGGGPVGPDTPASAPLAPADVGTRSEEPATPAMWLAEVATPAADRTAVRQALNGRYDAHARIVARRLSEDPGLRAVAGSAADITAGLVAVRAYLLEEREPVNRVLRGHSTDPAEQQHAAVLARTAVYGLHRLPSVFGPVFHAAATGRAVVSGYRPGDELVEPAFLDVGLTPPAPDEETSVEIAIWSVSARRVAGLDVGDAAALFPPGSRFAVLAVDHSDQAPPRVLLRDLSAARTRGGDDLDRILSRLRDAPRRGRTLGDRPRSRYAPGLDDDGRRYRRPARPEDGRS